MDEVVFTSTEIAFIIHVLSKRILVDEEIRDVVRLLTSHVVYKKNNTNQKEIENDLHTQ